MARRPYSQLVGPPKPGKQAVEYLSPALSRVIQRSQLSGEKCDSSGSTAIKAIGYNSSSGRLTLTFPSGRTYAYFDVSPDEYRALCNADSKGRYFNQVIRDKYAYAKLG